jgi:hypothetical protein
MLRDEQALTEIFRRLGAPDPEQWAASQAREGINQLGRFVFLRQAWRLVAREGDPGWIQALSKQPGSDAPGGAMGPTTRRLLADGASPDDLVVFARHAQWQLLAGLCYLLEEAGLDEEEDSIDILWTLVQQDEEGGAEDEISGLHESVLGTGPTGREMRPLPHQRREPGAP